MDLLKGLEDISAILDSLKKECAIVEYALVGGLAVSVWGRPRATRDIEKTKLLAKSYRVDKKLEKLIFAVN